MRILQVLPALNFGGVEETILIISDALIKKNHQSFVASAGGSKVNQLNNSGAHHFLLPLNTRNPIIMLFNVFGLVKAIKLNKIDLVHARSRGPAWSAYFACKITGTKFVTTVHGAYKCQNFFKTLYNSVMVRGNKVIAISNFIKDYILQNYPQYIQEKYIVVINRGIDLAKFQPRNKRAVDVYRILLPGRYTRIKGQHVAIEALALLKDNVHLTFVGPIGRKESYYKSLQESAKELGIQNKVTFLESTTDMPKLMADADLIINPSTVPEAFGRTIAEAQAMGIPVIASNIGAPKEILIDCVTGYLIEPNNPKALAAAISKAIPTQLDMHQARTNMEKNFSLDVMCENTIKLYEAVISD